MSKRTIITLLLVVLIISGVFVAALSTIPPTSFFPPTPTTPTVWRTKDAMTETAATAEARKQPTPIWLTTLPGPARTEGMINCELGRTETWTPLRYATYDGVMYVMVRSASGCYGWMRDPG
mgnify:CR=1 FL=1